MYNAERYLAQCDSILAQTLQDMQVILVDDGSTDSSPAICDAYAGKDRRVQVIHKVNGRAASARNAGLRAAAGEYVAFVDADDWISPEMYEAMLAEGRMFACAIMCASGQRGVSLFPAQRGARLL